MTLPGINNAEMKRRGLEIEFSDSVFKGLSLILDFSQKKQISSFVIYLEEETFPLADLLFEFCAIAGGKQIDCLVVLPFFDSEILALLEEKNIRSRVRIGTEKELLLFFSEKENFPETSVELYYDHNRQRDWDISNAMSQCKQHSVACCFGCSDSFISASADDLRIVCGMESDMPFPKGNNCFRFVESLFLDRNGECFACRGLRNLPIGNIFSESFEEAVDNSTILSYYDDRCRRIKNPCRECADFASCAGCRGRAYQYSKDAFSADPGCRHNASQLDKIIRLPISDPESYLPHKKPMLMVSELLEVCDNTCETLCIIEPDNPFLLGNGRLDPAAFVEIGAQSMGFLGTFLEPEQKEGMLVEVSKFQCSGFPVYAQMRLKVSCRKIYEMPPWGIGAFTIYSEDGTFIASGEVKVCHIVP